MIAFNDRSRKWCVLGWCALRVAPTNLGFSLTTSPVFLFSSLASLEKNACSFNDWKCRTAGEPLMIGMSTLKITTLASNFVTTFMGSFASQRTDPDTICAGSHLSRFTMTLSPANARPFDESLICKAKESWRVN